MSFGVDSLGRERCVPFSCPERIPHRSDPETAVCQVSSAAIYPLFFIFVRCLLQSAKAYRFFFINFWPLLQEHLAWGIPLLVALSSQQVPSSLRNGRSF